MQYTQLRCRVLISYQWHEMSFLESSTRLQRCKNDKSFLTKIRITEEVYNRTDLKASFSFVSPRKKRAGDDQTTTLLRPDSFPR